jgi:HEAT repeat protein
VLSVLVQAIRIRWTAAVLVAACALLLSGSPARAHILPGSVSLEQRIRAADVVAIARISNPLTVVELGNPSRRRTVADAEVMEVLRGDAKRGPMRFVPHSHGGAEYAKGEEVLLFLQRVDRNRELAGAGLPETIRYTGIDDVGDHVTLSAASRDTFIAAVRDYTEAMSKDAAGKGQAVGRVTLKLVGSKEPKIAESALRDLALGNVVITEADLPALEALIGDASRSIGLRVGLLIELDRRKLVDTPPHWVRLLKDTRPADIAAVARGAGKSRRPEVRQELVRWMESGDKQAAPAAAEALGSPGHHEAVEPLARAVQSDDGALRRAAVRGLGTIGSPEARQVLRRAAESHSEPEIRRLARTELNLLGEPRAASPPAPEATASPPSVLRTYWKAWVLLMLAASVTVAVGVKRWARGK